MAVLNLLLPEVYVGLDVTFFPLIGLTTLSDLLFMKKYIVLFFAGILYFFFVWKGAEQAIGGYFLVKWRKVTLPKELDGLGWL